MLKYIPWKQMLSILVEDHRILDVLIEVLRAMLEAGSARWREIARKMKGAEAATYKRWQRLVARFDPWPGVTRLCAENAPFGIGDLTDIERPQARRTAYVGWLPPKAKGRRPRRGFWVLLLGVPLRVGYCPVDGGPFRLAPWSRRPFPCIARSGRPWNGCKACFRAGP